MKNLLFAFSLFLITTNLFSQNLNEVQKETTKMDVFSSKTGVILKFIDYSLPDIKLNYGIAQAKIRKIRSGGEMEYFYQLSKQGKYDKKTASIAYEDLLELIKSVEPLESESSIDLGLNPDYLENKFVTDDGLQLGYYISKGKVNWFLVLEKYGSDNTIFLKDLSDIKYSFNTAKLKIHELKNNL